MAVIKLEEVKVIKSFCFPKTKCVDVVCTIADNSHIIRNSFNNLVSKLNNNSILISSYAPWVAEALPIVSSFYLETVFNALLEKTVLITDSIAIERYILSCSRIKEASCESAETAVTESSVIDFLEYIDINALVSEKLLNLVKNAHSIKVIIHHSSHKELC